MTLGSKTLALSNVTVSSVTSTRAVVRWSTNLSSTSTVKYGTTTAYGAATPLYGLTLDHAVPVDGLSPGTTYHFQVVSSDSSTIVSSSDFMFSTLLPDGGSTVPTIPTGFVATAGNGSVSLSWNANLASDQVDRYQVYRNDSVIADGPTATSYTDTGLTNGTTYNYRISARRGRSGYGARQEGRERGGLDRQAVHRRSLCIHASRQAGPSGQGPSVVDQSGLSRLRQSRRGGDLRYLRDHRYVRQGSPPAPWAPRRPWRKPAPAPKRSSPSGARRAWWGAGRRIRSRPRRVARGAGGIVRCRLLRVGRP